MLSAAPAAPAAPSPAARRPPRLLLATAPRRAHGAVSSSRIRLDQIEIDLTLREIDAREAHAYRVSHLPAPARALTDQAHGAGLQLPIIAGYRRDMHQSVDRHLFQLHEQPELERARDGCLEFLAHSRLQIQAFEITHDVARRVVRAPFALRAFRAERLQLRGAVLVPGSRAGNDGCL